LLSNEEQKQDFSMRRLPGPAVGRLSEEGNFQGSIRFVSGLAENTNSIFCDGSSESETANGCLVLRSTAGTKNKSAMKGTAKTYIIRALRARHEDSRFSLDFTYHGCPDSRFYAHLREGVDPSESPMSDRTPAEFASKYAASRVLTPTSTSRRRNARLGIEFWRIKSKK
jgi:hypothetical protein